VKAYSDPTGWLNRAVRMAAGDPVTGRAPLYPAFLAVALRCVGDVLIWLVNLPFVLYLPVGIACLSKALMRVDTEQQRGPVFNSAAFYAMLIFVVANFSFLRELVNPYREALAFTFLLGGISLLVAGMRQLHPWKTAAGGLMVGLSIGVRETGVLALPSVALVYLSQVVRDRSFPWFRSLVWLAAGVVIGLAPLFVQNHMESGKFWLPSYAAKKFERQIEHAKQTSVENDTKPETQDSGAFTITLPQDIPIGGMSLGYFSQQSRRTARFLYRKYHWWGWALFVGGCVIAVRWGYVRLALFCLSSGLVFFLFYSCYYYVKERYVFAVDVFAVPLMGVGMAALFEAGFRITSRILPKMERAVRLAVPVVAVLIVMG